MRVTLTLALSREKYFWPKVNKTKTCWLWTAGCFKNGYGQFAIEEGQPGYAHIVSWVLKHRQEVPLGLELHHKCEIRNCVRPKHLQLTTRKNHIALTPNFIGNQRKARTHCPSNHPYSGDNLYISPKTGGRKCKICRRAARKRSKAKGDDRMEAVKE